MAPRTKKAEEAPKASASDRALTSWMEKMNKTFGEGSFSLSAEIEPYDVIPTGSIVLDYYTTVGGWVTGRLHELWGAEGAGKTTLAIISAVQAQKKFPDKLVAVINVEQRFDKSWAVLHGLNLARTVIVSPGSAEEVADQLKEMCRSGLFSLVIVDSIGAMLPEKAKDKDAEESVMGKEAQVITRMVKINAVEAARSNTTVLLLNQQRANFGYGADTTTPGGFALKHGTTSKMFIKRAGGENTAFKIKIDGEERIVGHVLAVNIQRNSVAPAYRTAQFPMFYVETEKFGPVGIDSADEAATIGIMAGVITLSGSWYTIHHTGERMQGRPALVEALRADPVTVATIREIAIAAVAPGHIAVLADEEEPDADAG